MLVTFVAPIDRWLVDSCHSFLAAWGEPRAASNLRRS